MEKLVSHGPLLSRVSGLLLAGSGIVMLAGAV
jgi:predicted metal-binding membrane protein